MHSLQLWKYNIKWDFSWSGQISIKERKKLEKIAEFIQHN